MNWSHGKDEHGVTIPRRRFCTRMHKELHGHKGLIRPEQTTSQKRHRIAILTERWAADSWADEMRWYADNEAAIDAAYHRFFDLDDAEIDMIRPAFLALNALEPEEISAIAQRNLTQPSEEADAHIGTIIDQFHRAGRSDLARRSARIYGRP